MKFLLIILCIMGHASMKNGVFSIYAVDGDGTVLIDEHGDTAVVPASCLKIVTTGAALFILGPESRFETILEYDGEIKENTLHGNLYIRGGGDPTLGSDRFVPW